MLVTLFNARYPFTLRTGGYDTCTWKGVAYVRGRITPATPGIEDFKLTNNST